MSAGLCQSPVLDVHVAFFNEMMTLSGLSDQVRLRLHYVQCSGAQYHTSAPPCH